MPERVSPFFTVYVPCLPHRLFRGVGGGQGEHGAGQEERGPAAQGAGVEGGDLGVPAAVAEVVLRDGPQRLPAGDGVLAALPGPPVAGFLVSDGRGALRQWRLGRASRWPTRCGGGGRGGCGRDGGSGDEEQDGCSDQAAGGGLRQGQAREGGRASAHAGGR